MATFTLRRFADPDALKSIAPENLLELLKPHKEFFARRDVVLPVEAPEKPLDYKGIVSVLMSPDTDTPQDLADKLYFIHEMATPEGADELLEELKTRGQDVPAESTPADIAIRAWIFSPELLERKHSEHYLAKPRSYVCFHTDLNPIPPYRDPAEIELKPLTEDLDDWFESKKRSRCAKIFAYRKDDGIWFLVRHGELFKRDSGVQGDESKSVYYRPEKHDVVHYIPETGEIRIHACSKKEIELYREKFGQHIFGDANFFSGKSKYTLEPLRVDGALSMACSDVEGLDWVKLTELNVFYGGAESSSVTYSATDIFKSFEAHGREIPKGGALVRAKLLVKFSAAKQPRTVVVRPPNTAQYCRAGDGVLVEEFFKKRKFVKNGNRPEGAANEHDGVAVVNA